jgi:hypothetical protein
VVAFFILGVIALFSVAVSHDLKVAAQQNCTKTEELHK